MPLAPQKLFTEPDAWNGGSYELAVLLGSRDDERLLAALDATWSFKDLEGCYDRLDAEPDQQPRLTPVDGGRDLLTLLRGQARTPTGVLVTCLTVAVREDGGNDWLYFGLPLGSLGRAYPVGAFPWDDGTSLAWREELDTWLRALALHIFAKQPFEMALVGFVDAEQESESVLKDGVPERRWFGYLMPENGALRWYPPNEGAPIR